MPHALRRASRTNAMNLIEYCCSVSVFVVFAASNVAAQNQESFPPIDNSEFFGVKSTGTVTQRFEIYDPHTLADLQAVEAMGFDQVILDRAPLHKEATALGLDVVIANWWTDETDQQLIDDSIKLSREVDSGRLVGISVMDEPERNSPDTPFKFYVDLYQKLKPLMVDELSGVRLEISYWGPLASWDQRYYEYFSFLYEAADVMRLMPYPDLHEGPLGDVYLMMQRSDRAMAIAEVDIPQIVILQTWVLSPENKLPNIRELRVMAYQVMLGGAETLSFFEYKPEIWDQTPGFTAQFSELMTELLALRQRLTGAQIESVLHENGILEAIATWSSGRREMLRVNTNRDETEEMDGLEIQDTSLSVPLLTSPVTPEWASGDAVAFGPIKCDSRPKAFVLSQDTACVQTSKCQVAVVRRRLAQGSRIFNNWSPRRRACSPERSLRMLNCFRR